MTGRWLLTVGWVWCAIVCAGTSIAQPDSTPPQIGDARYLAAASFSAAPAPKRDTIPGMREIREAWNGPAGSYEQQVARTRRAALELGIWNLDAAARSLIGSSSTPSVERARAAVELAPDLPLARMALARALWLEENSPFAAIRAIWSALTAIPRHLEASLWFAGTGFYVLALALVFGGLLSLAVSASGVASHAAHDLGDAISGEMPAFARVALLASLLLVPLALGQGLVGAGLSMLGVAALYGPLRQLGVLLVASGAVVLGLYPVAQLSGATLTAYSHDRIAEASYSATEGFATPVDLRRLEARADDPLAVRALAVTERRAGNLGAADAHYQRILASDSSDPALLNNAANVRLSLGHMELALDLYRQAVGLGASARILFNLSQAYGAAFLVDDLTETLARAQQLDGAVVAELTRLQGSDQKGFTIDLPLDRRTLWERTQQGPAASEFAAEFRAGLAPGLLGLHWGVTLAAFVVVALGATAAGTRLRASHLCRRCRRRLCPRCDLEFGGGEICEGCTRLFHQPETTDRSLRLARIAELARRDARMNRVVLLTSIFVPGSAGLLARRYGWCLIGSLSAVLAICAIVFRNGVAVDPLVAGSAAPVAFIGIAVVCLATHAVAVTASLAARRRE